DVGPAVGLGDEVDALGGAAREDDLLLGRGVEEALHLLAGLVVLLGGQRAEEVDGPVDVGVVQLIVAAGRVDYRLRLLRGGGVVEVDQRLAVGLAVEDREVVADLLQVEQRRQRLVVRLRLLLGGGNDAHTASLAVRAAKRSCSSWSRSDSILMRPMM